ncbi:MAG: ASKHA domain-containing protein [Bryobacteraceae bacterium]|jgi:uncharacterized 2Fe-2S/4Fe-4S cluster protein (DUF4445 family)
MPERIRLDPPRPEDLRDLLFERGVEFPCGGDSLCGGCKIRVVEGDVPITAEMGAVLSSEELANGWRLACRAGASGPVVVEIEQWSVHVLTDETRLALEPAEGFGIAIDLGTTTLVAQLVDLASGDIIAVETALNPLCRHGADVMSRVQFEIEQPGVLRRLIRRSLGAMVADLAGGRVLREVLIAGNTVMHHLFCGQDVEPLSRVPFRSPALAGCRFEAVELEWRVPIELGVRFLPCIGGFVGSDLLAGLVAAGIGESDASLALLDLGTNGEIAVGCRDGIRCASTAAGPAFEGGRIRNGMRAGAGAIDRVSRDGDELRCHVIGGGSARGICGSGVVDAAAAALDLGWIDERGRMTGGRAEIALDGVALVQSDIRELQLAKGAIRAGLDILVRQSGAGLPRLLLAGAFGNYIRTESARRIGLVPAGAVDVKPAGNTALRGTRMLLLSPSRRDGIVEGLLRRTRHIELAAMPEFQEVFVERMTLG